MIRRQSPGNGAFFMVALNPGIQEKQESSQNHICVLKYAQRYSQSRIGKGIPGFYSCKEDAKKTCKEDPTLHC